MKTALRPIDYLQVLSHLVELNGQFLISAFDLADVADDHDSAVNTMRVARQSGAIIMMDSGNYESFWKNAQATWQKSNFHAMLSQFQSDIAFSFDEQQPPIDINKHVELVVARWRADQEVAGDCLIVPIIHGSAADLPELCHRVAGETGVPMVAVPERRLGDGIIARACTVEALRRNLNTFDRYVSLHLLGTGNPISIALYAKMGADSFDGLEWCQTVVDHETALLFHLSQSDFFQAQTKWDDVNLSFHARTLAHNLEFYTSWMRRLRGALFAGKIVEFCQHNFPARIFQQCATAFKWD